jgi:hypothetical protein
MGGGSKDIDSNSREMRIEPAELLRIANAELCQMLAAGHRDAEPVAQPPRELKAVRADNPEFRDYPLTGHVADMFFGRRELPQREETG